MQQFLGISKSINLSNGIYTYVKIDISEIHRLIKLVVSKYTQVVKMKDFKGILKKNEIFPNIKKSFIN